MTPEKYKKRTSSRDLFRMRLLRKIPKGDPYHYKHEDALLVTFRPRVEDKRHFSGNVVVYPELPWVSTQAVTPAIERKLRKVFGYDVVVEGIRPLPLMKIREIIK